MGTSEGCIWVPRKAGAHRDQLRCPAGLAAAAGCKAVLGGVPGSVGGCAEEGPNLSRQGGLTAMARRFGADGGRGIVSNARNHRAVWSAIVCQWRRRVRPVFIDRIERIS